MREYAMKKLVFALVITLLSSNAVAVWEYFGTSLDTVSIFYIDHAKIRKSGDLAKMWVLSDYKATKTFDKYIYLSDMQQYEYDCKKEKWRIIAVFAYKENMGRGDVVFYHGDLQGKWEILPPKSAGEMQLKIACGEEHIRRPHTASGNAEWVKFGEAGGGIFYYDPIAIQKKGESRIVWILIDLMPPVSKSGVFSIQIRKEYDCKKEKSRNLAVFQHSNSMGLGDIIASSDDMSETRKQYELGSFEDNMFNILCEKRG